MESPRSSPAPLTPSQQAAVAARGNVLVMAGAGTGKTKTLVARCLDCLETERASLDELLVVTFTEAAAAEMRQRLRRELEKCAAEQPDEEHWSRQLALFDTAHIGTLHSFCLRLVREHFYELGLDPQFSVLDEIQARLLTDDTLDAQFAAHYEQKTDSSAAVLALIQAYAAGRDDTIRALVRQLHRYAQTRPDAAQWLQDQLAIFQTKEPAQWREWLLAAMADWCNEWLPLLQHLRESNPKAAELLGLMQPLTGNFDRTLAATVLSEVIAAFETGSWPKSIKGKLKKPLEPLIKQATFLASLSEIKDGIDPLAQDWQWVQQYMATLLKLTAEFTMLYSARKQGDGVLDFQDLEQFALKLLWDFPKDRPTAIATHWREKIRLVLVDEYQDINAAQDKIIAALARDGAAANRFLVGDVKQSIYRFRLADPGIFRAYAEGWQPPAGQTIALSENFRSREGLLDFVNSVFPLIQRKEVGGVEYDDSAHLKFGAPTERAALGLAADQAPTVELLIRRKAHADEGDDDELADMEDPQKEARLAARQLKQFQTSGHRVWDEALKDFRPVEWRDMTVLLRSPRNKSAAFVKEFERAGVPLAVERGGFYESSEILDLLSLLQLLDNPLQDVPCLAVLRSPLVGLSLDQLAEIRLVAREKQFWTALNHAHQSGAIKDAGLKAVIARFLESFGEWRKLIRQVSLSQCLEAVLSETHYLEWLKAQSRGAQRAANVDRFLQLAQQFDQFQREGLYRFLQFIEAQRAIEAEPEVASAIAENAVRLMSIHQSKGLEFPVVLIADLAKTFNEQDLAADIIFDDVYGLCPCVKPPGARQRYPSLPHWLAKQHQRQELRGEELRLLYVAFTRARDRLILLTSATDKKWESAWLAAPPVTPQTIAAARSFADWLSQWFSFYLGADLKANDATATTGNCESLSWRRVMESELGDEAQNDGQLIDSTAAGNSIRWNKNTLAKLELVLSWEYGHLAATQRKAKASVTELRRAAENLDEEAEPLYFDRGQGGGISRRELSAAEFGNAHHTFLQHVVLAHTNNGMELEVEADRMVAEKVLLPGERANLDFTALMGFFESELGKKIREHAAEVRRELPFTASFRPAEIVEIIGGALEPGLADEMIVVQGVADLMIRLPKEIWLVDFKTDTFKPAELAEKVRIYTPQLKLYARALEKVFPGATTKSWLHFLALNHSVAVG